MCWDLILLQGKYKSWTIQGTTAPPCSWETRGHSVQVSQRSFQLSHIPDRILQQKGKTFLSQCTSEEQGAEQGWVPDPSQSLHCCSFLPSGMLIYNCTWVFTWISGRKVPSAPNAGQRDKTSPEHQVQAHTCGARLHHANGSAEPALLLQPHLCQVLSVTPELQNLLLFPLWGFL